MQPGTFLLLQPMDGENPTERLDQEAEILREIAPEWDFQLRGIPVAWDRDLTAWPAASPFAGQADFGDGAEDTLARALTMAREARAGMETCRGVILGGYSLAGLFALWAGYRTDALAAVVAASPSVWYPGWMEFARGTRFQAGAAYLSLGDREERTRNPVMRTVGDHLRAQRELLQAQGVPNTLVWNPGNHFMDAERRTAQGFAWAMEHAAERGDDR